MTYISIQFKVIHKPQGPQSPSQFQLCLGSVVSNSSATPWTVSRQAPLSMGFSRQECWSGFPFPTPGDLSNLRIEPTSLVSPVLAGGFFTTAFSGSFCQISFPISLFSNMFFKMCRNQKILQIRKTIMLSSNPYLNQRILQNFKLPENNIHLFV